MNINGQEINYYNEECLSKLKSLKDNSIDCCIVDPPYGIDFKNSHSEDSENWDSYDSNEDFENFTIEWLNEVYRVLKPNGTCWMFWAPTQLDSISNIVKQTQFTNHLENWITYARNKGRGAKSKLKSLAEFCWHLTKDPKDYTWHSEEYKRRVIVPYTLKGGEKRGWDYEDNIPKRWTGVGNVQAFSEMIPDPKAKVRGRIPDISSGEPLLSDGTASDVMFCTPPSHLSKTEKRIHSCQKPILLLSMLILMSSKEEDTILDPFMGSGSCGVAAALCNRNFIGIEKSEDTFEKAKEWINKVDFDELRLYVADRVSSSEENGAFSFGVRNFMPKTN